MAAEPTRKEESTRFAESTRKNCITEIPLDYLTGKNALRRPVILVAEVNYEVERLLV
jgi:hypothetical protein